MITSEFMLNTCDRNIYIFFLEKNILIVDGIIWTDGVIRNAVEVGQEGNWKAEKVC